MSRQPSDATLLRHARTENRELGKLLKGAQQDREVYRARATKAEQEVAEWKQRFDMLLKHPSYSAGPAP